MLFLDKGLNFFIQNLLQQNNQTKQRTLNINLFLGERKVDVQVACEQTWHISENAR